MTAQELRQKFLDFFKSKEHAIIPSASLIPRETDPTVLFTTAGMHPLVPYLLGEDHPGGRRVANVQKCIRTVDIEEVGDNRHLTFFEMLGNWSFGDPASPDGIGGAGYFKREAIEWSWEFLTGKKWLELDPKRIYVTVFQEEQGIPRDEESIMIWQEVLAKAGISSSVAGENSIIKDDIRIISLGTDDNFWIASATGPCGPDTEMFYDTRPADGPINDTFENLVNSGRLIEMWNDVFMEFNKTTDGKYEKLKQKNVDTGMGVERTLAVLNGKETVFDTELFEPIFKKIKNVIPDSIRDPEMDSRLRGNDNDDQKSYRIIADHIKAAVFILADSVVPSNVLQGYVLRRLIRRAIRHGKIIGIQNNFTRAIAKVVIETYEDFYPEVGENKNRILEELEKEEDKFRKTLEKGLKELDLLLKIDQAMPFSVATSKSGWVSGEEAFNLYQSYGFPLELFFEELDRRNIMYDKNSINRDFNKRFIKHQKLSETAAAGQFKGGLAQVSEETARLHTATHLLLAALRNVLGPHVYQKGSNITAERLRFDFSHPQKMTSEEIKKVERIVNDYIERNLPVVAEEMSIEEAKKIGAMGVFDAKYGEKVRVYTIGEKMFPISIEICGGPHANSTGELGHFRIVKEEASSAGVRRIKAILE
ncbi:MAG: alanine--tRNA ligase [Candidatus Moranbacteria bacterium]|nr:alanine--tRNA ligase [Candidatus Moranbacteria bacterium]